MVSGPIHKKGLGRGERGGIRKRYILSPGGCGHSLTCRIICTSKKTVKGPWRRMAEREKYLKKVVSKDAVKPELGARNSDTLEAVKTYE